MPDVKTKGDVEPKGKEKKVKVLPVISSTAGEECCAPACGPDTCRS